MPLTDVNYLAILVTAIVNMAVGFVWYGPLFGKTWMRLVGIRQKDIESKKSEMPKLYGTMFLITLLFAYILANIVYWAGSTTLIGGAKVGVFVWLGFVATTSLGGYIFSGRPMKLYYLENGHHLVNFAISGAILAFWR